MVHRMDADIGRVLDQLRTMGALENTVVFFFSDNGASAEILVRGDGHDPKAAPGSAGSFLCLGPGGSTLSNTPFRRHKIWVHEGGVATPLVVHWPQGIKARGELRHDVGHVVDFLPTILELAGGKPGEKWNGLDVPPLPGKSLVPAFAKDRAVERDYVFFHHSGNRALRMGDWKIVSANDNQNTWELYDLAADRSETTNLADKQPDRVRQMSARWQALEDDFRRQAEVGAPKEETPAKPKAKAKAAKAQP
jgi:arylsulfatase